MKPEAEVSEDFVAWKNAWIIERKATHEEKNRKRKKNGTGDVRGTNSRSQSDDWDSKKLWKIEKKDGKQNYNREKQDWRTRNRNVKEEKPKQEDGREVKGSDAWIAGKNALGIRRKGKKNRREEGRKQEEEEEGQGRKAMAVTGGRKDKWATDTPLNEQWGRKRNDEEDEIKKMEGRKSWEQW